MKYLQSPPVQRFQAGGMPLPVTPVPTNPDAKRPIAPSKAQSYGGSQRKTIATLRMLDKVM